MNKQRKNFISAFIGTALEFYDFALFGLLAPLFSKQFFPHDAAVTAIISIYFIFAAGFLIRPLGGAIFGYIGDRFGRRIVILLSIFTMMFPTFFIGILPTYKQIGIFAPLLLAICRVFQGLSAGGEFSSAAIFVIEHAHPSRQYFSGSLVTASSVVGMLMASLLATICLRESMPDWSWRIPFLLSVPLSLLGFYIRNNTHETETFVDSFNQKPITKVRFISFFKENIESMLITFGIGSFIGILYYVSFVFMGHYLTTIGNLTHSTSLFLITFGLITYMICICVSGFIADKIGPKKMMILSVIATFFLSYPSFLLIMTGNFLMILFAQLILSTLAGLFVGPANGFTANLFSVRDRCLGVSLSFNLGISLFGGFTPVLLTYIINETQMYICPAYWLLTGTLIAYISIFISIKKNNFIFINMSKNC